MIQGTLDQIKQSNMCEEGITAHEDYMKQNNLTTITFDQSVALDKSLGKRIWAIWAYENKSVFAKISGYTISAEEAASDALTLELLKSGVPTGRYSFNNIIYNSLAEAQNAKNAFDTQKLQTALGKAVCNLALIDEKGNEVWSIVDLTTATEPTSGTWSYKVFNHLTGQYVTVSSLSEAKTTQQTLAQQDANSFNVSIYSVNTFPDFPNEAPVLTEYNET